MGSLTSKRMGRSRDDRDPRCHWLATHRMRVTVRSRKESQGKDWSGVLQGSSAENTDCEVHSTKIYQQITKALLGLYNQQVSRLVNKSLTWVQVLDIPIPHRWRAPNWRGSGGFFLGGCCTTTSTYCETSASLRRRREMWGTVTPDF